jgi:HAD superfamily hydrolase (TIGR01509 family)
VNVPPTSTPRIATRVLCIVVAIRALIFDFDGLILDTETSAYESTREVYAEHGLDLPLAEWQQIIGTADHPHWTDLLEHALGAAIDRAEVRPRRDRRKLELLAPEVVLPGVSDLLVEAADAGLGVAVASSSPAEWVDAHLERLDLDHRFAHVITRSDLDGDVTRTKPAPDLYELALRALGADPSRSVAFEDSPNGLAAAKAAGLFCVAVPGGVTRGLDFSAADVVVDSLAEVRLAELAPRVAAPR